MKVNASRIDGFILAQEECDAIIRQRGLRNIHRAFFQTFDAKFIIGRSQDTAGIDRRISHIIEAMKRDGSFERLSRQIHKEYEQWQPCSAP